MNKHLFTFITLCIFVNNVQATHIVGGEFELQHIEGETYHLRLITYFDDFNGNPSILNTETTVNPYIFRKSDGEQMARLSLSRTEYTNFVPYTNDECRRDEISTRRIIFENTIQLPADIYNDPEGYTIVWERCCRNRTITNINAPSTQGNKFYLDIPPVTKNGAPFVNSSPSLFPPLSDYACIGHLYYVDFAGFDRDGDSLVYSLVNPLNSSSQEAIPIPTSDTFIEIEWQDGFDLNNIIPGTPPLGISSAGFITVRPNITGLFVFSVLVEEFRSGVKIGQLNRDFQMFVIDECDPNEPPVVVVEKPDGSIYEQGDTIKFTADEDKCFDFLVTDDTQGAVFFDALGVNFDQGLEDIFDVDTGFLSSDLDTMRVTVCMPQCPLIFGEPALIDLIAGDDVCPKPQFDTTRLVIDIEPPPNQAPFYTNEDEFKNVTLLESEIFTEEIQALDMDGDSLILSILSKDFFPEEWGMSFEITKNEPGEVVLLFNWDTSCNEYPFGVQNRFDLKIIVGDADLCKDPKGDTIAYDLNVILPLNTSPIVFTPSGQNRIAENIKSSISVNVNATDEDNDLIQLSAVGDGFELEALGAFFEDAEGVGSVESTLTWNLSCADLNITENETFRVLFIAEDEDLCRQINFDTLVFEVDVVVPFNNRPTFELYPDFELPINVPFSLDIIASDFDDDLINLTLLEGQSLPPSPSFNFNPESGEGEVSSNLRWTPECALLGENDSPQDYTIYFLAFDDNCPNIKADTLELNFVITELSVDYGSFEPPNVFTPNGDSFNDTYRLEGLEDLNQNLPPDNCADEFQAISIVDRYGKLVFFSDDRNFEWRGFGLPASTYYYHIQYLNSDYRGTITILH